MSVVEALTEEEMALVAILQDASGVDVAEFLWKDPDAPDSLFRCWDFQIPWYRNKNKKQIDQCGRGVGKSVGIQMRAFAFPFANAGQEMLITAPEMIHLDPVTRNIEDRLMSTRISQEMLKVGNNSTGIKHRPFEATFRNGSKIIGRIPQKDGKGVKGCVAEGTIILTRRGLLPIEQVVVGDEAFTHERRWRKVVANFRYENPDGFVIAGGGHRGLITSDNHRLYARRNRNPQRTRNLEWPAWVCVDDDELAERYYLGSPVRFPEEPVPVEFDSPQLLWVIGRYVADGHLTFDKGTSGRIHVIVDEDHVQDVVTHMEAASLRPTARRRAHNGTFEVEFSSTHLARLIEKHFGRHADGKTVPVWLLGARRDLRESFLSGYLSGDGYWDGKKRRWTASTASHALAVGVRLLGQTLDYTAGMSWVDPKPNAMCAAPLRSYRVTLSESRRNVIVSERIAWQKVRSVTPVQDIPAVYDLTVEEDHSYLADGLISHNMHPRLLEQDEAQDYPKQGWIELIETLRYAQEGARWRAHGVSRGVGNDHFYKLSTSADWRTHRWCLPEGTLIYGVDGPFEIQDAVPGTLVWSVAPDGSLVEREVIDRLDNGERATWSVVATGGLSLETTLNHPYLVLHRDGTRRTRRDLRFEWVEAQDVKPGDYIVGVRELDSTGVRIPQPSEITAMLEAHSPIREVPEWVWGAPRALQLSFLAGYLMGDGSLSHQIRGQDPWQVSTSSKKMARQLRALCHYLGLRCTRLTPSTAKRGLGDVMTMYGFYVYADSSRYAQIPYAYSSVTDGQVLEGLDKRLIARRVTNSCPSGRVVHTYDITVEEHHNYIAEGVVVHNTAMHRPDWTAEERDAKIELYTSRDDPDYRRNILGLHGDSLSPLFVLHRLMACVDQNPESDYNTSEYVHLRINDEWLRDSGLPIEAHLDLPGSHKMYEKFWIGMDIGLTNHPSEILIFAEEIVQTKGAAAVTRLKCIGRIHLQRISSPDQIRVLEYLCAFYKPEALAIDRTGLGLPIYQYAINPNECSPELNRAIRGYNFSEKIPVAFTPPEEDEWVPDDDIMDRAVMGNVLEYSSDMLRLLVDQRRLRFPWDVDMLREFQGQAYYTRVSNLNPYGKKEFNKGKFHALDAARMGVLAFVQRDIEAIVNDLKQRFQGTPMLGIEQGLLTDDVLSAQNDDWGGMGGMDMFWEG